MEMGFLLALKYIFAYYRVKSFIYARIMLEGGILVFWVKKKTTKKKTREQ